MIPEKEIEDLINSFENPEFHIAQLMRKYGKQQWNQAIKLAAKNAEISWGEEILKNAYQDVLWVDEESILKLLK